MAEIIKIDEEGQEYNFKGDKETEKIERPKEGEFKDDDEPDEPPKQT